jgi:TonB family protein
MTPDTVDTAAAGVLLTMLDAGARALIVGGLAALLLVLVRPRRAAVRLTIWTFALGASIAIPLLGAIAPSIAWSIPAPAFVTSAWTSGVLADAIEPDSRVDTAAAVAPLFDDATAAAPPQDVTRWMRVAAGVYLAGVLILLARGAAGWHLTRRLRRSARAITDEDAVDLVRKHAAGMARPPSLAESDALRVPVTMATVRPVVMLPADWREWSPAQLNAVLAHEVAHAARRDLFVQRLSMLYRALTWCHPFSWWLHRRLADLAEQASDEAALDAGANRQAYARLLLDFLTRLGDEPRRVAWHVAMTRRADAAVERRIDRILTWKGTPPMTHAIRSLILAGLALAPVAGLAATVRLTPAPDDLALPAVVAPAVTPPPPDVAASVGGGDSARQQVPRPRVARSRVHEGQATAPTTVRGVSLGLGSGNSDAPATVVRATSSVDDGAYATIVVRNDGTRTIRVVHVAALVRPAGDPTVPPRDPTAPARTFASAPLVTWIPPGESRPLESRLINPAILNTLASLGPHGASAVLEITRLEFSDGSAWTPSARVPSELSGDQNLQRVEPRALRTRVPNYTSAAMRAKIQGEVLVEVSVDASGFVTDARVVESLDPIFGLDANAVEAARQWRFTPALLDGRPVPATARITLQFRLH